MAKPIYSQDEFHDALMGEDELGVVLRSHFYIEAELDALINALLEFPNECPRLRYEQKVKLACALGLDRTASPPLKELGNLRNTFGHEIGARLTDGMLDKLFDSFTVEDQALIIQGYNKSRAQLLDALPDFKDLGEKDRFVVLAITLHKMLVSVVLEVQTNITPPG